VPRQLPGPFLYLYSLLVAKALEMASGLYHRPADWDLSHWPLQLRYQVATAVFLAPVLTLTPATPLLSAKLTDIAKRQLDCPLVQQTRMSATLHVQRVAVRGVQLLCDVLCTVRPLAPATDMCAVLGHSPPGRMRTAPAFVWHGMAKDVNSWYEDCQTCQLGKVTKQPAAPIQKFPTPAAGEILPCSCGTVGPLLSAEEGHTYLQTIINRTTKWVESIPLKSIKAIQRVPEHFVSGWVNMLGVPLTVTTDRGMQFTYTMWDTLCSQLGMEHLLTTTFHPQANGMVEPAHREIKEVPGQQGLCGTATCYGCSEG
jgi:hypothetical protein